MTPHEALQADLADVKAHLAIAFVMETYGHHPDHQGPDGKLHYLNPFRSDEDPSFDVFPQLIKGRQEPEERFGDFAESSNGDVIDLVQRFEACSRTMALSKGREILAEQLESDWDGPTVERIEHQALSMASVEELYELRRPLAASDTWFSLVRSHPGLTDAELPSSRVFMHPQHDTLVYMLADEEGDVKGVRFRGFDGSKYGLAGTRNILMRLDDPKPEAPVFLCEGETDTWAAWSALGEDYEVLGVPGMGNHPEKTSGTYLTGRTVFIAFDPDTAGDIGRAQWTEYLLGIGCTIKTIILPSGKDIAGLHPEAIMRLPDRARHLPPAPERLVRLGDRYCMVINKNGDVDERSNWSFEPKSVLVGGGGERAYKGYLHPHDRLVTLPASALSTSAALKRWGSKYEAFWYGTDQQVQLLAGLLAHESAYLPEGRVTTQVGLHEGTFVWHNGHIGGIPVEYVPPVSDIGIGNEEVSLPLVDENPVTTFLSLFRSQHPAVTGPILAWLAAAPLRTRFHQFPTLNVSGASGSGKSELTAEFLRVFSGSHLAVTLSSTTPYAVSSFIDSSNGFPVWFDEYRPGARETAKDQLDQLLRDTYTMQSSVKGGQDRSNLSALATIRTSCPLIVSGEDSFTETSHTDRMVLVRLRQSEQGDLRRLPTISGFARQYLTFLTRPGPDASDPEPPVFGSPALLPSEYEGLRPRQEANIQVLGYGWRLLGEFLSMHDHEFEMPQLNLSRVVEQGVSAGESNPVLDLIKVCLENDTRTPVVWRWNEFLCVHPDNFVRESRDYPAIVLPVSNAKGVKDLLIEQHGGEGPLITPVSIPAFAGRRVRAIRIPLDTLDWFNDTKEPNDHHPEI